MAGLQGIEFGKRYKLSITKTQRHLISFQYNFKPPVDEDADARLNIDSNTGRWSVRFKSGLRSKKAKLSEECFEGSRVQSTGESILVWNPSSEGEHDGAFTIETVAAPVHLIHRATDADSQTISARLGDQHRNARNTEARFQQLLKGKKHPAARPIKQLECTQPSKRVKFDKSATDVIAVSASVEYSDDEDLFGDSASRCELGKGSRTADVSQGEGESAVEDVTGQV